MKKHLLFFTCILLTILSACNNSSKNIEEPLIEVSEKTSINKHLEDISNDTLISSGKVIKAIDIGWAYTYGLSVNVGNDTLDFNYFTEKFNENSILNQEVTLNYYYKIKYRIVPPNDTLEGVHKITGIYNILSYGGDLPGAYTVTNKNGDSIIIEVFLYDNDGLMQGKEVTEYYSEDYELVVRSLTLNNKGINTSLLGNWNVKTSDSITQGSQLIKIQPGDNDGLYIDFGEGSSYYKTNISSSIIEGQNIGGEFKIELNLENQSILNYSDNGRDGHFEPITDQKYSKHIDENNQLLVGNWQNTDSKEVLVITEKELIFENNTDSYVLCNSCLEDVYDEENNDKNQFVSTLDEENRPLSCIMILELNKTSLKYVFLSTTDNEVHHFSRITRGIKKN